MTKKNLYHNEITIFSLILLLFLPFYQGENGKMDLEMAGAWCSLVCVWWNTQRDSQAWYWAIVGSILYGIVFFQAKLYGNFLVQIFFFLISIYGLWEWVFSKNKINFQTNKTQINENLPKYYHFPPKLYLNVLLINIFLGLGLGFVFIRFFEIKFGFIFILDICSSVMSITAQYLLVKKYIENWFFWVAVNVLVIIIALYSVLYLTAGLYLLFLGLAIYGYYSWKAEK